MTPKEQYEAHKAERRAERQRVAALQQHSQARDEAAIEYLMDTLERVALSMERIADELEQRPQP